MGLSDKSLATVLAETEDLGRFQAALVREKVIRNTMAQTSEDRETVVDMVDALESMDQEAVLDLAEGEPTTLADGLRRYVGTLDQAAEEAETVQAAQVVGDLVALLAYPWSDEEALIQLHEPHHGLELHVIQQEYDRTEVRMGSNRLLLANINHDGDHTSEVIREVAEAVHRATLARVIPDRDHHVQLNAAQVADLRGWLARPNGSLVDQFNGRLTLDAVEGGGVLVRTRSFVHQYILPVPPLDQV